jgi:hypothetical protein
MKTTSTTQTSMLKKCLLPVFFILSLFFSYSVNAQNGCVSCTLKYPDNSNLPRSAQVFSESDVLVAFDPGPSICGKAPEYIKVWYSDEHALTLGVRRVIVKTSAGTTTTDYPITATPSTPTCVDHPLVGTTVSSGDQSGNDVAVDGGRPLWPAVFITDLTVNGASSRNGDWQQGGTGIAPSRVCGTWKAAVRTVDKTKNTVTVTPDADPAKNDWDLGGGDTPPSMPKSEGFTAEIQWKVSDLNLIPGHSYRLQFMVHDGDQNKDGGDAGDTCTTIVVPLAPSSIGDFVWDDNGGADFSKAQNGIQDAGEPGIPNITVALYNAAGNIVATTFTDANGKFIFNNVDVSAGCTQYKVGFSPLPNKYTWTFKNKGTNVNLNSDVNPGTGITDLFTICPGESRLDIDAGMFNPGGTTPVTISQFQGKYENGASVLNWLMSAQDNIKSYDIERSTNAASYITIGNVKAITNNSSYIFNDKYPLEGTNYYRLKINNTNGGFTYGNTVAINVTLKGISVKTIYPNPFKSQLKVTVASENSEPVTIRVMDNSGRVLKVLNVTTQKGSNEFLVNDLGNLTSGMYVVEVKTPFTSVRSKVSK